MSIKVPQSGQTNSRFGAGTLTGIGAGVPAVDVDADTSPIGVSSSCASEPVRDPESRSPDIASSSAARGLPLEAELGADSSTLCSFLTALDGAPFAAAAPPGRAPLLAAATFSAASAAFLASSSRLRLRSASLDLLASRAAELRSAASRSASAARFDPQVCARSTAAALDSRRLARSFGSSAGGIGPVA